MLGFFVLGKKIYCDRKSAVIGILLEFSRTSLHSIEAKKKPCSLETGGVTALTENSVESDKRPPLHLAGSRKRDAVFGTEMKWTLIGAVGIKVGLSGPDNGGFEGSVGQSYSADLHQTTCQRQKLSPLADYRGTPRTIVRFRYLSDSDGGSQEGI